MAKKSFNKPRLYDGWGGEGSETGGGSGGTSDDPTLVSFDDEWYEMYGEDYTNDGNINIDDYIAWWVNCGFDQDEDLWELMNPSIPYPW